MLGFPTNGRVFGVQLPSLLSFEPPSPDLEGRGGEDQSASSKPRGQAAGTSNPTRTGAEAKPCTRPRTPRGWAVGCPGPLLPALHPLCTRAGPSLRPVVPLRRGPGRRSRLCCGPASLRLQHKTRGVGAAPGSRVVARGLTPCHGKPGLRVPASLPRPAGPPGFGLGNPTC